MLQPDTLNSNKASDSSIDSSYQATAKADGAPISSVSVSGDASPDWEEVISLEMVRLE
jgi:hypothetical protein